MAGFALFFCSNFVIDFYSLLWCTDDKSSRNRCSIKLYTLQNYKKIIIADTAAFWVGQNVLELFHMRRMARFGRDSATWAKQNGNKLYRFSSGNLISIKTILTNLPAKDFFSLFFCLFLCRIFRVSAHDRNSWPANTHTHTRKRFLYIRPLEDKGLDEGNRWEFLWDSVHLRAVKFTFIYHGGEGFLLAILEQQINW